jgi:hypothetical protein
LCIIFGCSSHENATVVYTQWCLMTTFVLLNNLVCTNNTYKVIHLVMDLIGLNCYWRGLKGLVILIDLWQLWQITGSNHPSQIAFCTLKVKRFLGTPSDSIIVSLCKQWFHCPNCVNFSCPQVIILAIEPNIVKDICMQ